MAAKITTRDTARGASGLTSVGLVLLDIANPFFAEVARGAEDAAAASHVAVVLCNSDGSVDRQTRYLEDLRDLHVSGLAITPAGDRVDRLGLLQERGVAIVLLDHPSDSDIMCSVSVDNIKGGAYVGRHLFSLGHERVAFVGAEGVRQVTDRRQGLRAALSDHGLGPDAVVDVTIPAMTAECGEEAAERLLRQSHAPTAVFCANDLLAMGLLKKLAATGVDVPGDFAVVGYDDIPYAASLHTPLTTVRQPRYGLGQAAMRLLLDDLANPQGHRHQHKVFAPELVVRASSAS